MKYPVSFDGKESVIYGYEPSEYISSYLAKGTFYEEPLLTHILAEYTPKSVIDVGANIGNHAAFFHDVMGVSDVTAFEPNEENFRRLIRSAPHATSYRVALSDRDGTTGYVESPGNMGAGYCTGDGIIPARKLDDYGLRPDLIKIDAEGMEVAVLRGARETVKRALPVLVVEHNDIQHFYQFARELQGIARYTVKPFLEETWEVFIYEPN